jgi:4-hydroxybenzoate polyprenyltransferase
VIAVAEAVGKGLWRRKTGPVPGPDPLEPACRLAAAAVAHAQCAVGGGGRVSRLAFAGGVCAGHHPDAQRGCCINDVADRDFDRHVKRTAQRPVTSGRVGQGSLVVGAVLALVAFGLVLTTNAATVAWSLPALAGDHSLPVCQALCCHAAGGAGRGVQLWHPDGVCRRAGAMCRQLGWVLLLGNLFWVLAYDTEYAMVDRDDDLKIGMKTSAITWALGCGRWSCCSTVFYSYLGCSAYAVCLVCYFLYSNWSGAGAGSVALDR